MGIHLILKAGATALGLLLSSAIMANAETPAIKGDGGKIRLLYSPFGTNSYPPFVIKKYELDKKYGFELEIVTSLTTQSKMIAFRSGGAEVGTSDWNEISRLRAAGINLIGVAPFLQWGADFVVVKKDSPLKNLGDLKGKKFGVSSKTSLNYIVERAVAKNVYKVDLEKDATVQEAAQPLLQGLLEQGELDASEIFNSVTPGMVVSGKFRPLVKISDLVKMIGPPDTPFLLYAFDMEYVKKNPANVRAYTAAYREAVHLLRTVDDLWIERGRELKQPDEASAAFRIEARKDVWDKFQPTTEADIRKIFDIMLKEAGPEIMGTTSLPSDFMTLEFQ